MDRNLNLFHFAFGSFSKIFTIKFMENTSIKNSWMSPGTGKLSTKFLAN
jgi:hypothetical protein